MFSANKFKTFFSFLSYLYIAFYHLTTIRCTLRPVFVIISAKYTPLFNIDTSIMSESLDSWRFITSRPSAV